MAALRKRALAIDPEEASVLGAMGRALFISYARFARPRSGSSARSRIPNAGWYSLQLAHCAALLREFARGERAAARARGAAGGVPVRARGAVHRRRYMRAGHLAALQGRHARGGRASSSARSTSSCAPSTRCATGSSSSSTRGSGRRTRSSATRRRRTAVFEVALESFERRVRLGADEPFTRYYAAAVHALRGEAEPALALLERALAQQPAFTAARAPRSSRSSKPARRPAVYPAGAGRGTR